MPTCAPVSPQCTVRTSQRAICVVPSDGLRVPTDRFSRTTYPGRLKARVELPGSCSHWLVRMVSYGCWVAVRVRGCVRGVRVFFVAVASCQANGPNPNGVCLFLLGGRCGCGFWVWDFGWLCGLRGGCPRAVARNARGGCLAASGSPAGLLPRPRSGVGL